MTISLSNLHSSARAVDADPTNSGPVDRGCDEVLDPVCGRCGADLGIFIKFGLDWRHYREGAALGQAEIFDPGHAAELAWRLPDSAPAGI
jgi:hypothetical protein